MSTLQSFVFALFTRKPAETRVFSGTYCVHGLYVMLRLNFILEAVWDSSLDVTWRD